MKPFARLRLAAAILGAQSILLAASVYAATATVGMTDTLRFTPQTLTVHVSDTVVWENDSALTHTVTDVPKLASRPGDAALPKGSEPFNSGYLDPGKRYAHTFTVPGTYHYFCIPHEATGMVGTVIVEPTVH